MVRKSIKDVMRDSMSRGAKNRRNALNGPYTCPKCAEKTVQLMIDENIKTIDTIIRSGLEQKVISIKGKEYIYHYSCKNYRDDCTWKGTIITTQQKKPVDMYCKLYDEHVAPEIRHAQLVTLRNASPEGTIRISGGTITAGKFADPKKREKKWKNPWKFDEKKN